MISSRSDASLTSSAAVSSRGRVHAHVERRVGRVRETALRPVDLHARDAEVEQDRVRVDAVVGQLVEDDRGLAAQEARLDARVALEPFEVRAHGRVAVDRDEATVALQVSSEHRGVAAGAEGGVDDGLPGLDREELAHLLGEDGNVISLVWLQDVRQHLLRSLPLLSAPCARRRGPRSPGDPSRPRRRRSGRALRAGSRAAGIITRPWRSSSASMAPEKKKRCIRRPSWLSGSSAASRDSTSVSQSSRR